MSPTSFRRGQSVPMVDSEFVELQVRAQNGTAASAWSPIARVSPLAPPSRTPSGSPPRMPKWTKWIVFGVVLVAVVASIVTGVSAELRGRESQARTPSREGTDSTARRQEQGGAASADDGHAVSKRPIRDSCGPTVTSPRIKTLVRWTPSVSRTNADSLTWRIAFTEPVRRIDETDFTLTGIERGSLMLTEPNGLDSVYHITLSGQALADHNGEVALGVSASANIEDFAGNPLDKTNPMDKRAVLHRQRGAARCRNCAARLERKAHENGRAPPGKQCQPGSGRKRRARSHRGGSSGR